MVVGMVVGNVVDLFWNMVGSPGKRLALRRSGQVSHRAIPACVDRHAHIDDYLVRCVLSVIRIYIRHRPYSDKHGGVS